MSAAKLRAYPDDAAASAPRALPRLGIARSLSDLGYAVLPRARSHVLLEHRALGLPTLRLAALAEQLLYQVLFPVSLPLVWAARGGAAVRNLQFVPGGGRTSGFVFQLVLSLAVWAQVGLFLGSGLASVPPGPGRDAQWFFLRYDLIMSVVFLFFQRLPVATKWAYLPAAEYGDLMRRVVPAADLVKYQVLYSWVPMTDAAQREELLAAQGRLGVDAAGVAFDVAGRRWTTCCRSRSQEKSKCAYYTDHCQASAL